MRFYDRTTTVTAIAMIALGIAILVVTLVHSPGVVGILLGLLFVAAGAGRLWMLRRRGVL